MIRHAEWREASGPERPLARYDAVLRIAGAVAFSAVGLYCCCGIGMIPGFVGGWAYLSNLQTRRRLERLRDEPTRYAQHACRLTLRFGDTPYGRDEGLVTFVDGFLVFEGRRSTFSLTRLCYPSQPYDPNGFTFPTPAGICRAVLTPLGSKEYEADLARWLSGEVVDASVIVFPPTIPQTTAWRSAARLGQVGGVVAILGLGAALITGGLGNFVVALIIAMLTALSAGSFCQIGVDRRKDLERLQEKNDRRED